MYPEPTSGWRTSFQRDRDRIVHSTSFRRLKGKTQVFLAGEGDHYRTRLTHTLEVAQIARSLARALKFDEDLTEAIALAHDLGHPPFGHSGERALARATADYGGFEHNIQCLRVVTLLERRYPLFDGLNLSWEVLEGLVKHNGPLAGTIATEAGGRAKSTVVDEINNWNDLLLTSYASGEAQCAAIADDIAYNAHDIDDGLRSGLLRVDELRDVPKLSAILNSIQTEFPQLDNERLVSELVRRLINWLVEDVIGEAGRRVANIEPSTDAIRWAGRPVVAFSSEVADAESEIKGYLYTELYRNTVVAEVMDKAEALVIALFERYRSDPGALPVAWRAGLADADAAHKMRHITDFLAGMTDRFALSEYQRLFDRLPEFG